MDAGGEDWGHWKNLLEIRFAIYNYLHLLCKTDEIGTDFLSTFFTFDLNFRNFKDWITFRSDILDGKYENVYGLVAS